MSQTIADLIVKISTDNTRAIAGLTAVETKMSGLKTSSIAAGTAAGTGLSTGLAASTGKIEGVVAGLGGKVKGIGAGISAGLGQAVTGLASMINPATLAIGAVAGVGVALAVTTNKAIDFQKSMAEVFTLLPNATSEMREEMVSDLKAFDSQMGVTSDKSIPALYQAISAGVPADNVFSFLEISQKAAVGGCTELTTAVDGITSVMNAYGSDVISASEASDLMFTAVKGGKTNFDSLSKSLFNVVPVASSLGLGFESVTAAISSMTAQGTPTSVATTQMRQMLLELSKSSSETAKTFESLAGKSFKDFIAEGHNLQDALQLMESGAKSSGKQLNDLFSSAEAGNAALALTGKGTQKFTDDLNAMASATGATEEAFSTMENTLQHKMDKIGAAWENVILVVGDAVATLVSYLIDVFGKIWEMLQPVFNFLSAVFMPIFGTIGEVFKEFYGIVEEMITAFGELLSAMFDSTDGGKGLMDIINSITGAMTTLIRVAALPMKAAFEMITTTIRVLTALLRGDFQGAFGHIESMATKIKTVLQTALKMALDFAISFVTTDLPAILIQIPGKILEMRQAMQDAMVGIMKAVLDALITGFEGLKDWIVGAGFTMIKNAFDIIVNGISDIWGHIFTAFEGIWENIIGFLKGDISLVDAIKGIVSTVNTMLGGIAGTAWETGKKYIANLINGMLDGIPGLRAVTDAVGNFIGWVMGETETTTYTPAPTNPNTPAPETTPAPEDTPRDTLIKKYAALNVKDPGKMADAQLKKQLKNSIAAQVTVQSGASGVDINSNTVNIGTSTGGASVPLSKTPLADIIPEWQQVINTWEQFDSNAQATVKTIDDMYSVMGYSYKFSDDAITIAIEKMGMYGSVAKTAYTSITDQIINLQSEHRKTTDEILIDYDTWRMGGSTALDPLFESFGKITNAAKLTKTESSKLLEYLVNNSGKAIDDLITDFKTLAPTIGVSKEQVDIIVSALSGMKDSGVTDLGVLKTTFSSTFESAKTAAKDATSAIQAYIDGLTGKDLSIRLVQTAGGLSIQSDLTDMMSGMSSLGINATGSGVNISNATKAEISGAVSSAVPAWDNTKSSDENWAILENAIYARLGKTATSQTLVSAGVESAKNSSFNWVDTTTNDKISAITNAVTAGVANRATDIFSGLESSNNYQSPYGALCTGSGTAITNNSCLFQGGSFSSSGNSSGVFTPAGTYCSSMQTTPTSGGIPNMAASYRASAGNILQWAKGMADGGTNLSGGVTLVGEDGPELMAMPRNASVLPLPFITNILSKLSSSFVGIAGNRGGGAQSGNLTINNSGMFNGAVFKVRDEQDIYSIGQKVSAMLGEQAISSRRRAGVA